MGVLEGAKERERDEMGSLAGTEESGQGGMRVFQEDGRAFAFLYTVACHEDELELCRMEMRTMLGAEPEEGGVISRIDIPPSRSPFIKYKIAVRYEGATTEELAAQAGAIKLGGQTFKLVFVETDGRIPYEEQRGLKDKSACK